MIDMSSARDVLLDIPYISNVRITGNISYSNKYFIEGFKCNLLFPGQSIEIFIGIPETWMRELVSIYLIDYVSLPFMPHIESDGKICLFDLEGVLIDYNFEGLLEQCIERAKLILQNGLFEDNRQEFVREFSSYWSYQKPIRLMKFALPEDHRTQLIKWCDPSLTVQKRKKENLTSFQQRKKTATIFASADSQYFSLWNVNDSQHNGLFLHLSAEEYILPPDFRKPLQVSYVQSLLDLVCFDEIKRVLDKLGNTTIVTFEIIEPGGEPVYFGILLNNYKIEKKKQGICITKTSVNSAITAIDIFRIDEAFLTQRTGNGDLERMPKVLLVGCGSIGGYLCSELVKSGYKNIDLVDDDIYKEENIYRHFLNGEYVGKYKAEALRLQCSKYFPNIHIRATVGRAEDLIEEGSVELQDYSLVISATGNHNFNRWLNRFVHEKKIDVPCVYLWNEPLDVGCHLAVIQNKYLGCYECFFKRNHENNELFDATAFSLPGQMITKQSRGCAGSFVPYSSNVSLRIVSVCMEWIEKIVTGRCNQNYLISIKGDAYNFTKMGYMCSEVFYKQTEKEKIIDGSTFVQNQCDVCGGQRYGN